MKFKVGDKVRVKPSTEVADEQPPLSEEKQVSDPVNHPSHYASGGIECIEAIKASMSKEAFCGFLKANVLKYLWRYEKKVAPLEDIKKASWYLTRLIKELDCQ